MISTYQDKYSPTSLTLFMRSPFASWMNRFALECPGKAPEKDPEDGLLNVLQNRGLGHEKVQEALFQSQGLSVQKIEAANRELKKQATLQAMKNGVDVIVQAYLEKGEFFGYADFLVKVPGQSELGDYHYEVWDTKLSNKTKPEFIIQLCCYSDMLSAMQGRLPDSVVVVLGSGEQNRFNLIDYVYYYCALKENFLIFQYG